MRDKALYLSAAELRIMAAAAGVERFYCFSLDAAQKDRRKTEVQALCSMLNAGLCTLENGSLRLKEETFGLFETIRTAETVLLAEGTENSLIAYLNRRCTVLVPRGSEFRAEAIERDALFDWLEEMWGFPAPYFKTQEEAVQALEENEVPQKEYAKLMTGTELTDMEVLADLRFMDARTQKTTAQYRFVKGLLNLWCVYMDENGSVLQVAADSEELRSGLIKETEE